MKLSDFHTLYINLEKDEERMKAVEGDLKSYKIDFNRINAVWGKRLNEEDYRLKIAKILDLEPQKLEPEYWLNRKNFKTMCKYPKATMSKVGCYLSHLYALKVAVEQNYDKVLILEDDVIIESNREFEIPEDADILYVGGYWMKQKGYKQNDSDVIPIDTRNMKICGCYSFIYPTRQKILDAYNLFRSVFLEGPGKDKHKDWRGGKVRMRAETSDFHLINFFQKYGKTYILNPPLTDIRPFPSNISDNRGRYKLFTHQ
tara:strand:- start:395 stop:1168 length:774 start_codon:yes stop_codon:yes gene_type:complete